MNFSTSNNARLLRLAYATFAFMTALFYDFFFWHQEKGLGFFIFVTMYIVGLTSLTALTKRLHNAWALLLAAPILILSFDVMLYTNDLVAHLVPWVVFGLAVIFTLLISLCNAEKKQFFFRAIPVVKSIDLPFTKWGQVMRDLFSWRKDTKHSELYKKIAMSILIAVPILFIFGFLFAQADAIFADSIGKLFSFKVNIEPSLLWRIIRTLIFGLYIASFLYVVMGEEHAVRDYVHGVRKLDATVAGIVLALVNSLFLVFVFIQIKYLFGSASFVLTHQLTFADYARHGFFELVAVMVLASSLVALWYRSFAVHGYHKAVAVLQIFLIVQVGVIAVSALKRMNLYQDEYGYTTLRLYVEWFIYFSLFGLVGLVASIATKFNFRIFFYTVVVYGLVAFTVVCSLNVNGIIARRNIERYMLEGKKLDLDYLMSLGPDAMPWIAQLYNSPLNSTQIALEMPLAVLAKNDHVSFATGLELKKQDLTDRYNSWRETNLSVQRALSNMRTIKAVH